ncbi:MAG TPA: DUF5320 domain-containing protein [Clostridia bacterium]|nr:DUF5320 domain-containing protein [Clostridia bacterium]
MPRMDRTGPMGRGPMTGRGFGVCNDAEPAAYGRGRGFGLRRGFACGFGRGFGRGFGSRRGFSDEAYDSRTDKDFLENQKEMLESRLEEISKELEDL